LFPRRLIPRYRKLPLPALTGSILLLWQARKPGRQPGPCLGPTVLGLRDGAEGDRADLQGMPGSHSGSRMVPGLLLRSALRGRVRLRLERRAKSAPWAQLLWALALPLTHPRQNMRVAAEEAQTRLPGRCPFFCGAVSARASICACQAFNTETELRAISEEVTNHGR
jgi:hypothetical protein